MFKKWFWNLLLFAINVFGFLLLSYFISGMILNHEPSEKKESQESYEINSTQSFNYETTTVCFSDNACITCEIADTLEKQRYGLMFRDKLERNRGMLFTFPDDATRTFHMQNMNFPIEIIWIDSNRIITHYEHAYECNTPNCVKYSYKARYVVEVSNNFIEDNNINLGDSIKIG